MNAKSFDIKEAFLAKFGSEPVLSQAPGRINIIGEHTDYNNGFVLPGAINYSAFFAAQKNDKNYCRVVALDLDEEKHFNLARTIERESSGWINYILGVVNGLQQKGVAIAGFDLMFSSDVPIGAGLSSSAAIESACGLLLNNLFGGEVTREELAFIGQKAEHEFVGVMCGIMDQFASIYGEKDHVLKIDCRSLEYECIPADFGQYQLVLIDSKVKHELVDSEYNLRREQCSAGVAELKTLYPAIQSLRDATMVELNSIGDRLDPKVYNRCRYVIEENERVLEATEAIKHQDMDALGRLMYETHAGLRELYEVSIPELDLLVDLTESLPAIPGSRMMGGGFGGCTINLVKKSDCSQLVSGILKEYHRETGIAAKPYFVELSDGAHIIKRTD